MTENNEHQAAGAVGIRAAQLVSKVVVT